MIINDYDEFLLEKRDTDQGREHLEADRNPPRCLLLTSAAACWNVCIRIECGASVQKGSRVWNLRRTAGSSDM